jgi:hypothetical protein
MTRRVVVSTSQSCAACSASVGNAATCGCSAFGRPASTRAPSRTGRDQHGAIRWHRQRIFISTALCGAYIQLEPDAGTRWAVLFGRILLGHIDGAKPEAGLLATPRRRKSHVLQLEGV